MTSTAATATASASTTTVPDLDALMLLESPFAKMPYEDLRRRLRAHQRITETQFASMNAVLRDVEQQQRGSKGNDDLDRQQMAHKVALLIERVKATKDKLLPLSSEFASSLDSLQQRTAHLGQVHQIASTSERWSASQDLDAQAAYQHWSDTRLNRMITDWLLRRGYVQAAETLVQSRGIEPLTDLPIFKELIAIRASLIPPAAAGQKPSCALALAWCTDNKVALKRIKSTLEFDIRVQEFIDLCRTRTNASLTAAIAYSRRHLLPPYRNAFNALSASKRTGGAAEVAQDEAADFSLTNARVAATLQDGSGGGGGGGDDGGVEARANEKIVETVGRALGLLAVGPGGWQYDDLYSSTRYTKLYEELLGAALHIYSLPPQPVLHIALSAGLSSLKVPACYRGERAAAPGHANSTDAGEVDEELMRHVRREVRAETAKHEAEAAEAAARKSGGSGSAGTSLTQEEMKNPNCPVCATVRFTGGGGGGGAQSAGSSSGSGSGSASGPPPPQTLGLGVLAREVPWSHHSNSTIVCRISGSVIDDSESGGGGPVALPNGRVYSKRALEETCLTAEPVAGAGGGGGRGTGSGRGSPAAGAGAGASSSGSGSSASPTAAMYVICPRTKKRFHRSTMRKVYIS